MAEIKVNITELNNAIARLQSLNSKCNSLDTASPETVGGGMTVNEIEEMAKLYKNMNGQMGKLISNTISFLQNVRDSYAEGDAKAAQMISGQ